MKACTMICTILSVIFAVAFAASSQAAVTVGYAAIEALQVGPGQDDVVVVQLDGHGDLPGPACSKNEQCWL